VSVADIFNTIALFQHLMNVWYSTEVNNESLVHPLIKH